jgi:putative colanic acid biosynthesis acetyltransferase WcaF
MAKIEIKEYALISQGAHLCCGNHDIHCSDFTLFTKPITIGAHAWVAADAFVAPGVTIGEGAVLGARAVALGDLAPWSVYVGNPATERRMRNKNIAARHQS